MQKARSFALIGYPLGHTMSPPIHAALFALAGQTGDYQVMEIPPEALSGRVGALRALTGFNVTIPHKLEIIPHLDALSDSARRFGAVNTVRCGEQMVGYNTDVDGFLRSLREAGVETRDQRVLILGAGGAGRMMAIELALRGCDVVLAVRLGGVPRAEGVLADIRALSPHARARLVLMDEVLPLMEREGAFDLMCNATPVGMFPKVEAMPATEEMMAGCRQVFDAIYNPGETRLLACARRLSKKAVGGMSMLVWQAVAAHEIWDGSSYDPADIAALTVRFEREMAKTGR
ncbi:shikimate dehydrogenase [Oscillospiraceae bacterium NSJ-54]|uniref:Shikimate dehydrogenase (NADP(+)) n=2 Tax=Zongyangia hominis TaxID=2763677 RepID=A0A926EBW6_9FIRM|nr:shikimate dehydrogenase [Zongyangia hominis]